MVQLQHKTSWTNLRGLNFAAIKFSGFRGFRKYREIKSRGKICNGPTAKLNPHENSFKNKTNPRNFNIFFKQTYTVFIRYKA